MGSTGFDSEWNYWVST